MSEEEVRWRTGEWVTGGSLKLGVVFIFRSIIGTQNLNKINYETPNTPTLKPHCILDF